MDVVITGMSKSEKWMWPVEARHTYSDAFAPFRLLIVDLEVSFCSQALDSEPPWIPLVAGELLEWRGDREIVSCEVTVAQVEDWKCQVLRLIPPRDNCDAPHSIIRIIVIILNNLRSRPGAYAKPPHPPRYARLRVRKITLADIQLRLYFTLTCTPRSLL